MKARRRHELQQNVLKAELAKSLEFLQRRRTLIVWSIVLVAMAILAVTYVVRSAQNKRRSLQVTYDSLVSSTTVSSQEFLDGMKSLAESSDDRLAALATIQVGKFYAAQSLAAGGQSDDPRQRDLRDQAAAYFHRAIATFPGQSLIVGEAHLGLARLAESVGDVTTAAKEYQAVNQMADLAGTPALVEAAGALDRLDRIAAPVRMATTRSAMAKSE